MNRNKQSGFSLIISLLLLMTLTIIGLAIMRSSILSEKQASNVQEKSVSFHGAQTTNNSIVESYRYDQAILAQTLNAKDLTIKTCVDYTGNVTTDCDVTPTIDSSTGVLKGGTDTTYRGCPSAFKCVGNSSGMNNKNTVGCNVFQHYGEAWVDSNRDGIEDANEAKTEIEQWSLLVAACGNS
ncbi:hypothetical protein GCM10009123_01000 [Kangiella japonica]|uniref:Type 4 fimbrial biogenesis protein PilX N-terminal domain-containing protein n=1 Tax=Kangiella japonica TaxID=647384 RepID=A0ABN0STL4_9GAMM